MDGDATRAGTNHPDKTNDRRWPRRLAWLLAIWGASVVALGIVAYVFRAVMGWVGLTR